ncbi:MAG: uroporphyrinogen decarboxylase family protein [Anaerolineae bacterium]
MNSRQRLSAAMRRQDVDYVPCCQPFTASLLGPQYTWVGRADSLERIVGELGLDATVPVSIEAFWHPDVSTRVWTEQRPGDRWPVMHKQIDTPAGPLTAAIWVTDDLEHKDDIPLNSDWNVSRYVKPWLETMEDVERYRYVQLPPSDAAIADARERFARQKALADRHGLATQAGCGLGLTSAISVFGAQQAVTVSMDHPEVIDRFLEIEHQATMRRAEVLAELGVDIIVRNGFYETTDFWSPGQVSRFLVPRLRREIEVMKSGGAAVCYTIETGVMPLLDVYADLEFDCYHAIEPALGHQDMAVVASRLGPRHAIWGGVSGPIHIGEGDTETARQAVRDAFATFGKRGLILSAVPSIRAHWPWANALAMFDEWRALRRF